MRVAIVDAQTTVYEQMAHKAQLPAYDGEITVLNFHQPFLYRLRGGVITIDDSFSITIRDGVARMARGNELIIMIER